jgi:hypothetical protein
VLKGLYIATQVTQDLQTAPEDAHMSLVQLHAQLEASALLARATKLSAALFDHNSKGTAELRFFFFSFFLPVSSVDLNSKRDVRLDRSSTSVLNTKQ